MITVKRKAKVGERIVVINADFSSLFVHKNGDILTVKTRVEDKNPLNQGIYSVEQTDYGFFKDSIFVRDEEYEVIEDDN